MTLTFINNILTPNQPKSHVCTLPVALPLFLWLAKMTSIFAENRMKITSAIFFSVTLGGWADEIYKHVNIKDINSISASLQMYLLHFSFNLISYLTEQAEYHILQAHISHSFI